MAITWKTQLKNNLVIRFGNDNGEKLYARYKDAFSAGYQEDFPAGTAVEDIQRIETLSETNPIAVSFYQSKNKACCFKLFNKDRAIPLSDILPIFENLGLRILQEKPYVISGYDCSCVYITEFAIEYKNNEIFQLDKAKEMFEQALIHISLGDAENDSLNQLVLSAQIEWYEVIILRAYIKYLRQTNIRYNQDYIEKTLVSYPKLANYFIELFKLSFDPKHQLEAAPKINELETKILQDIDQVVSLDEDRILRYFFKLIKATLRTNYFQLKGNEKYKNILSFKLRSAEVPELPQPLPLYEIFVYAPRFEGIHLRSAKVARGGIRWSDRPEDFRTEVLGLMKAQKVKNVVIVPSGAKGGFVLKAIPSEGGREAIQAEVVACYKAFISSLLDITDNIIDNKTVRPKDVVCYDDEDPYLVVAADKGTASFSDIANQISKDHGFWLGDAFASGGSAGYDHKKMAITARGAWESVKRHFRELNINIKTEEFTTIAIGDMSGDVCGNGLLYTKKMKLIAVFDHRHIFLDPNPDPEISYAERLRLFHLPYSSWEDYNPQLISQGGGVFKRSAKSIPISEEVKNALQIQADILTPNELMQAILKAPVTLLWNGGIGTFVKATEERNAEVGDRTNDFIRINGNELRCRAVGEGGNLGFTQLGRIEYALNGGLINTDFIDNSAGVDCSDHEVNLKIILNQEMMKGSLAEEERNQFLASMTEEVAALVLKDNYLQCLAISSSLVGINKQVDFFIYYLKEKTKRGDIDPIVEFLPDAKKLQERRLSDKGLTRPELAVLLAYEKIGLKEKILKSDVPELPYFADRVYALFPRELDKDYSPQIEKHPLRREIIATQISNEIINQMGTTFIFGIQEETSAPITDIIRAYTISVEIFKVRELQKEIEEHDDLIPVQRQYEIFDYLRQLIHLSTRWIIFNFPLKQDLKTIIDLYSQKTNILFDLVPELMSGNTKSYMQKMTDQFIQMGLEKGLAQRIGVSRAMYNALNIIEIATKNNFDVGRTAKFYFFIGEYFYFLWFRDQLLTEFTNSFITNYRARVHLRDQLDQQQKLLTTLLIKQAGNQEPEEEVKQWIERNPAVMEHLNKIVQPLLSIENPEFISLFTALGRLANLIRMNVSSE